MEIKSLNKAFQKSFIENWDRPALSNYQGATLFYRDVARRIAKLHIAFEQCGLQKGDKVAICSRNQANWGVSYLAALTYGAVAVPILHEFKPGNIHYLVNHSEAKVLFVDEVVWEGLTADEMPDLQVVVQINTFKFLYTKFEALWLVREHLNESFGRRYPNNFGPDDLNYYEDSPEEMAMINYTSGTSGFSKGVMIPYRALTSNVEFALQAEPHINNKSDVVAMLPSAHMYGMMFEFLFE
ncbi:MAG: AMP-binding protein, partial [Bacteroidales bacterium]|nr:AMP-binding protein [Bacteroidales bacterium]